MNRIQESEHDGVEARDFSWLVRALTQLRTARGVLSNSYAFAYFFFGGQLYAEDFDEHQNKVNQGLFEDNQEMLAAEVRRCLTGRGAGTVLAHHQTGRQVTQAATHGSSACTA